MADMPNRRFDRMTEDESDCGMSDDTRSTTPVPVILGPDAKPARKATSQNCPQCGAGTEKRVASSGFGLAHPCCGRCGWEWKDEVWRD